jgi:antitoxin component of MazEF toxin-antitoxin module
MKTLELNLAQIGNSRGIRLSADLIRKHGFEQGIVMEDRGHEIALRPKAGPKKLSWEETAQEMAVANEDWSVWDCTLADGLDQIRTVSKTRLTRKIGALKPDDAAALRELLTEMYGEE